MAQQGWDNQGFPLCFEHALGDLNRSENSHTGRRLSSCRIQAKQMTESDPRATRPQRFHLPERERPQGVPLKNLSKARRPTLLPASCRRSSCMLWSLSLSPKS